MRIDDMSLDQLLTLNQIICRRIEELQARQELGVLSRMNLGQVVSFETREGQIFGRVIKINRKTVVVQSDDSRQWKVSVGLIQPLRDV
ncbi:transposase [Halomonas sp. M4R1S46]|uniref:transposase n=1 Tax=Halomonas sp. M4R1S46 TaxID=2982692 RepID=UPI0021E4AC3B|nr:transposase [Halomonas sp. M4R1S46]UYG06082.1 transposase [Halomonas sp. M4R1S46]